LKIEQKNTLEKIDRLLNYNYKNNPTIQLAVNNNLIDYYQKTNKWKQSGQLISSTNKFVEQVISNGLIKNYYLLLSNLKLLTANQFIEKEEYKELNCKEALKLLKPFADESESLVYLLPFVKAHKCLNTLNAAAKQADFLTNLNITNFNL
ncbi:hypothetical protein QL989_17575, partial [Pseudoalteromonas sp. APC 3224]|uniref:hypothetical protein n=1 Tax=Pseudoalteromonas sp. APC 3224 TaxID=3035203 RepID=UPI0025B4012C